MRIKEIKVSIHRKYTKDFQSYGYRIGLQLEVGAVEGARSCYYEGKAFLNDRIAEEDLIIKNIMDKKDAEKSLGYKELAFVPEGNLIVKNIVDKGIAEKKLGYEVVVSYACEGCEKWITGEKGEDGKVFCKNCGYRVNVFATRKGRGRVNGDVDIDEKGKVGDGNVLVPFDVRQIKRTSLEAVLVELFGKKGDLWIPKSCIGDGDAMDLMQKGVKTMLRVKNWFLEKKGLI